jgi:hypothetical protein
VVCPRWGNDAQSACDFHQRKLALTVADALAACLRELHSLARDDTTDARHEEEEIVNEKHECHPPMEDRPKTEPKEWPCPRCGRLWRVEVIAEAYRFSEGGGPITLTHARWVLT